MDAIFQNKSPAARVKETAQYNSSRGRVPDPLTPHRNNFLFFLKSSFSFLSRDLFQDLAHAISLVSPSLKLFIKDVSQIFCTRHRKRT